MEKKQKSKVKCEECGKFFFRITNTHLRNCCGLTIQEYKKAHPGCMIESEELASSRVNHLRGKSYEAVYGDEEAKEMKTGRSMTTKKDWEENPLRLEVKQEAERKLQERIENPPLIGRPRQPEGFGTSLCQFCGKEFDYRKSDSSGFFCSRECYIRSSQLQASDYRIKAFAHYPNRCEICGEEEGRLIVHHRDKNRFNDDVDNLQILCNTCYLAAHADDRKTRGLISEAAIKRGMEEILRGLKVDIRDANFFKTPQRVAKAYLEIFEGLLPESIDLLENQFSTTFPCEYSQMILVKDIQCWSMCPHHFLPVKYQINMAYIPNGQVLGLSKLPRLVELLAKRPVLQEQLTQDIVDYLNKYAKPEGVIVQVSGEHLCMKMRGVKSRDSVAVTAALSGIFETDASAKAEFYSLL